MEPSLAIGQEDVLRRVGRYEIVREVGRGATAVVYLARQTDLDRHVALEELAHFHAADPAFIERFLRESRVAGSPQPVFRRQSQIARSSSGARRLGLRAGRLERSSRQERLRRSHPLARFQRHHQRCAVAGETLKVTAASLIEQPPAIASTSSRRPASPSLALR